MKYFTKNILRWFFIVLFMLFAMQAALFAQGPQQQTVSMSSPRQHICFDGDWKFHLGNAADPARDFNYMTTAISSKDTKAEETATAADFNDSSWRTLQLPHDWAVELPFENSANFVNERAISGSWV